MFPNRYNFNMPFYQPYASIGPNTISGLGLGNSFPPPMKTTGLLAKLRGLRGFNWQGILNNTSRTLSVINQAIPVIKQVGPMYNNMKSMLKIASIFKDETDPKPRKNSQNTTAKSNNTNIKTNNNFEIKEQPKEKNYDNTPNFFI